MLLNEIFRIDELTGVKAFNPDQVQNLTDLEGFMRQFGFVLLSGGEYSRVFENPKLGGVVKVYGDECYDRFIAYCKQHRDNPHLPKFDGSSVRLRPGARMIRIERLEPISKVDNEVFLGLYNLAKERMSSNYDPENDFWDVPAEDQSLLDTIIDLMKLKGPCWIDMLGNIMKRGNTLVIVDPYAPMRDGWATTHR